jgi:hypothetical protein
MAVVPKKTGLSMNWVENLWRRRVSTLWKRRTEVGTRTKRT